MSGFAAALLQTAVYDALKADSALMAKVDEVYDEPVASPTYPYVAIGDGKNNDLSTKTETLTEHTVQLDIWSDATGRMETKEIMELVHDALHGATLTVAGHVLVNLRFDEAEDIRDLDSAPRLYHGIMHFRAVTQFSP
jgi:hypothetical protein